MEAVLIDTSDLDRWVGRPIGGGQLKDPVSVNDVRRWVQAMQYPNPLHHDDVFAAASRFGRIVAPQSFTVATSDSHGAGPSIQGRIEGSHMLFGGDEWWFHGPRIAPGDRIRLQRRFHDYTVKETRFAGPTVFARGDTVYENERGEKVATQRCTSIRYLAEEARRRREARGGGDEAEPFRTDEELAAIEEQARAWTRTIAELGHDRRPAVAGERLPRRVLGPHSVLTFATEWRAFLSSVWSAFAPDELPTSLRQAGWLKEMDKDMEAARLDPAEADGLYKGSSRGHAQPRYAQKIGLARGYGYGASMGAWILDHLAAWAGEHAEIVHADLRYRAPVFTGDVTFLDGEVVSVEAGLATVRTTMTNDRAAVIATATAEVRL